MKLAIYPTWGNATKSFKKKIFDLTRGKYPILTHQGDNREYNDEHELAYDITLYLHPFGEFQPMFFDDVSRSSESRLEDILDRAPIYLVETSMSNTMVEIPGSPSEKVLVPMDNWLEQGPVEEFDIDKWVESKNPEKKPHHCDDFEERPVRDVKERIRREWEWNIADFLAVYVPYGQGHVFEPKIFVWIDKVVKCANNPDDAMALYKFVLWHELTHALMDVEMYDLTPARGFSYGKDYIYRFIEEAYANAFALAASYDDFKPNQKQFIEKFVKSQGNGYSHGWILYDQHHDNLAIDQWMGIKVLFDYNFALLLREFWNEKDSGKQLDVVHSISAGRLLAVKNAQDGKWFVIESETHQPAKFFKSYDSIDSFNEDGWCRVKLNGKYGFVNERGIEKVKPIYDYVAIRFVNGRVVAKLNGKYGIIDRHSNVLVPFTLDYADMHLLSDGNATMQDTNGKWGLLDDQGNVVVPCKEDRRIFQIESIDENGEIHYIVGRGFRLMPDEYIIR